MGRKIILSTETKEFVTEKNSKQNLNNGNELHRKDDEYLECQQNFCASKVKDKDRCAAAPVLMVHGSHVT